MFNTYSKEGSFIEFVSNPPLPDEEYIAPSEDESGVVRNVVAVRPGNNHSPLEGLHFDAAIDGLRARLNLGVPLKEVRPLDVQRDPLDLLNKARHFVDSVMVDYNRLSSQVAEPVVDSVETDLTPSNS